MKYGNYEGVKTRHANTAEISIGTEVVGEIAGLQLRESGGTDGSYTVGDANPFEHLHNRYTCSGSISRFVWRQSAMDRYNIGGKRLLDLPVFSITVRDDIDNKILYVVEDCTASDRSMNVQANQRIMSDLSFLALRVQDAEAGPNGSLQANNPGPEILPNGDTPNLADQPALASGGGGGIPI